MRKEKWFEIKTTERVLGEARLAFLNRSIYQLRICNGISWTGQYL